MVKTPPTDLDDIARTALRRVRLEAGHSKEDIDADEALLIRLNDELAAGASLDDAIAAAERSDPGRVPVRINGHRSQEASSASEI